MRRAVFVALTTLVLTLLGASAANASERCMVHGIPCNGGTTLSGKVTAKSWMPPREELHTVGKHAHTDQLGECWRVDVESWVFNGWVCLDKATWDRTNIGDQV